MKELLLASALMLVTSSVTPAANPYERVNGSWISIDGSVESVRPDSFVLDYGAGMITVEMDDGDRDADAYKLLRGDKVRVSGRIDADLFELRTIEAGSVYVESLGSYFYASAIDDEDAYLTYTTPIVVSNTVVQGEVTYVGADKFYVDTGNRVIKVDVDGMAYNPLDDEGYQRIGVGDRVSVSGELDTTFFGGRELEALSVVTLSNGDKNDEAES